MKIQQELPLPLKTFPLGDSAIVLQFGETISKDTLAHIKKLSAYLLAKPLDGMIEYVPGYTTLTIYYNPWLASDHGKYNAYERIAASISQIFQEVKFSQDSPSRQIEIPVCYGSEFGPDLEFVAHYNQLTTEEVISIHTGNEYLVHMIGFVQGFPYLGGMDRRIAAPRKSNPRLGIPVGSVGIAGKQTGIYPLETPGGWQLIGRTPLQLFKAESDQPSLLQAGDRLHFLAISREEFFALKEASS